MMPFVVGRPGEGKTYWLMTYIVFILRNTKRDIVTNLVEIKVPQLQAFLKLNHPEEYETLSLCLESRMRWITKLETRWFFRYRKNFDLPPVEEKWMQKQTPPGERDAFFERYFSDPLLAASGGVEYILDEAHRHFAAEEYADMAYIIRFYCTQHRHLDDNVTFSTQSPEQVVIQLRRLGGPCHVISNHYRQSFGWFQKKGGFLRRSFYTVKQAMSDTVEPYETAKTRLDKNGLATCYYTRGAIGNAMPEGAEEQVTKKKLPFWSIWVAFGVVGCGVAAAPYLLFKGGQKIVAPKLASGLKTDQPSQALLKTTKPETDQKIEPTKGDQTKPKNEDSNRPPNIYMRGYASVRGGGVRVVLSDGRVLTESDGIKEVRTNLVKLTDGSVYYLKQPITTTVAQ